MELLPGEACNVLVREGRLDAVAAARRVGAALAAVHGSVRAPPGLYDVANGDYIERYVRCAAPVEDQLLGDARERRTGFPAWVKASDGRRLRDARAALADATLPRGLLHGDGYADNVLFDAATGATALVDWEDAAAGPFAFDVATSIAGVGFASAPGDAALGDGAFPLAATLNAPVVRALLEAYAAARGAFTGAEADALRGLIFANALACAIYRYYAFHVADPNAPQAAKRSYREMHAICIALDGRDVGAAIDDIARSVVAPDASE